MNATIRRSWWLVPATMILLFEVALFLGPTRFRGLAPETASFGSRLASSAVWLLCTVCMAEIAIRNRRPQRAGWLVIVGTLPALLLVWAIVPPLLAIATIVGAMAHMTTTPSPREASA